MSRKDAFDRRSFLTASGGAAAAVTLAGCFGGQDPEDGGDGGSGDGGSGDTSDLLRYGRGSDSSTLDPQATTSGEDAKVTGQVYDQLVHFEPGESTLVEGLAEDYNIEETTVTLTLREDATFHNGDEFTAEDVVATYQRFYDEEYDYYLGSDASVYADYVYGPTTSVEATGDYEVVIELENRFAPYLRTIAMFSASILPKSEIENDHDFGEEPIGTGPFSFNNWNHGNGRIRLDPNEDYWGEAPSVGEVVFEAIDDNSTRAQTLDSGDLDIVDGLGPEQAEIVEGSDAADLEKQPGMNVGYMAFNLERVEEFREKEVRQAISHAINTEAIVKEIYRDQATNATHPIPPTVMGHNEDLDPYEYDPERAQELLDEAGYGDGFAFELATMTNPRPYFASPVQTAETVQSNLADVGIEVEINEQSSFDAYLEYTDEGSHDACFLGWISDNGDPNNFYEPLLHPGVSVDDVPDGQDWVGRDVEGMNIGNVAAWANTEFMERVEEAQQTYDEGEREEIYLEVAEIAHEEAPWVYMTYADELRGVNTRIDGYIVEVIGGPFLNLVEITE